MPDRHQGRTRSGGGESQDIGPRWRRVALQCCWLRSPCGQESRHRWSRPGRPMSPGLSQRVKFLKSAVALPARSRNSRAVRLPTNPRCTSRGKRYSYRRHRQQEAIPRLERLARTNTSYQKQLEDVRLGLQRLDGEIESLLKQYYSL